MHNFAADEREPHSRRPIELPIRNTDRVGRSDKPHRQVILRDALRKCPLHGLHLARDADIALAVPEVSEHPPNRLVDPCGVLAQDARRSNPPHISS
ncbi:MAG TPA: hypothetical protein PKD27_04710, partial [Tepidiformaceae bacterium]|nr:hypothetical protein [Tepidiformaceae bacterium]